MSNAQENANSISEPTVSCEESESMKPDIDETELWAQLTDDPSRSKQRRTVRYVFVGCHKNQIYVDIRNWVFKDDKMQPLKVKVGIRLTVQEFERLVSITPEIQADIKKRLDHNSSNSREQTPHIQQAK
ncbi:hypothetical protein M434DRAFT_11252 [Hypoxylon sp. CO27-5]|nr:hypothetical protein M434DRAFT_11252 [Hypoxylon sp. CO27-5]